ncbi:MAG: glutamate racemase, partial [Oscillospiraceae bacterium]
MCITINNLPIGVFDSGVGGLTAVKQLRLLVPNENIVYFGDTARVPYGTRNSETIIKYAKDDINVLLSKGVKIIVAACGTVSSTLPQKEIEKLPIPYLGVVESTANAAVNATKNGKIGIIGTDATIKSNSYKNIINALQPEYETFCVACPLFVPLVENGFIEKDNSVTLMVAHNYLDEIKSKGVDTLILGCTH